jgi:uncharacterized membrane protein
MAMAERQLNHRIKIENFAIPAQVKQSGRGQLFGLVIGIAGIISTLILGLCGHDGLAGVIGTASIGSLAIVFITGKRNQKRDLNKKNRKNATN